MPSFFLALLGAAAVTLAGREAVRAARLSAALGHARGLLAACWLACAAACVLAGWLGGAIASQLGPDLRPVPAGIVLLVAALELAVRRPARAPLEPTRSFGAIALVLAAGLMTGATALVVVAIAGFTNAPWPAAAGGTLGSGVALTSAWSLGREWEARLPLVALRALVAGLLVLAAVVTGLGGRGIGG